MGAINYLVDDELAHALTALGFRLNHSTVKLHQFARDQLVVYVKRKTKTRPLVIHPHYFNIVDSIRSLVEVELAVPAKSYINSNLRAFSVYQVDHRVSESRHGIAVGVTRHSLTDLVNLLQHNTKIETPDGPIRAVCSEADPLTERERLQAARVGQGEFRSSLISYWQGTCPVTQVDHPAVLRASHIKSWSVSSNSERLNPNNGVLLAAHLDALFDRNLITFEDDGRLLISSLVSPANISRLGIPGGIRINGLSSEHAPFLQHHRAQFSP